MPSPPKRGFIKAAGKRFPDAKILHRYTGVVYLGKNRAGFNISRWPRPRGPKGTPAQMEARADFKRMAEGVNAMMDEDKVGARLLAHGTSDAWRDVLSRAATGTLITIKWNGTEEKIVKTFLDALGTTPGMIIICTVDGWIAYTPGDESQVLAIVDGLPAWTDAATAAITQLHGDVTAGPGAGDQLATLAASGVTAGSYTSADITVDAKGRVTHAADGAPDTGITELVGDVTAGPGSGSQSATLADTAVSPGSYTAANITVDAKGRITDASDGGGSGAGASLTLIATNTVNSGDTVSEFTGLAAGNTYLMVIKDFIGTPGIQFGTGSTPTWDTGTNYRYRANFSGTGGFNTSFNSEAANWIFLSGGSTPGMNGSVIIRTKTCIIDANGPNVDGHDYYAPGVGRWTGSGSYTAVRLVAQSGTFTSGKVSLYELAE